MQPGPIAVLEGSGADVRHMVQKLGEPGFFPECLVRVCPVDIAVQMNADVLILVPIDEMEEDPPALKNVGWAVYDQDDLTSFFKVLRDAVSWSLKEGDIDYVPDQASATKFVKDSSPSFSGVLACMAEFPDLKRAGLTALVLLLKPDAAPVTYESASLRQMLCVHHVNYPHSVVRPVHDSVATVPVPGKDRAGMLVFGDGHPEVVGKFRARDVLYVPRHGDVAGAVGSTLEQGSIQRAAEEWAMVDMFQNGVHMSESQMEQLVSAFETHVAHPSRVDDMTAALKLALNCMGPDQKDVQKDEADTDMMHALVLSSLLTNLLVPGNDVSKALATVLPRHPSAAQTWGLHRAIQKQWLALAQATDIVTRLLAEVFPEPTVTETALVQWMSSPNAMEFARTPHMRDIVRKVVESIFPSSPTPAQPARKRSRHT